jgi:hypothetical protein
MISKFSWKSQHWYSAEGEVLSGSAIGNEQKFAIYLIMYEMEENMIDILF